MFCLWQRSNSLCNKIHFIDLAHKFSRDVANEQESTEYPCARVCHRWIFYQVRRMRPIRPGIAMTPMVEAI
jgi:hypothetical protein